MKKKKKNLIAILTVIISIIYTIYTNEIKTTYSLDNTINTFNETTSTLTVSFLDVGQADAILIQNKDENMLIDAGNNEDGTLLVDYFNSLNINNFKYIVGTHPHEDHIGGLDDIIDNFTIEKIYLPDAITTTKTFLEVLTSIENKNLTYTVPKLNETFTLGDATFKVIYTGTDTKNLNNASIVLKLTLNNISFLFTGDAPKEIEEKILNKDLKANILKVGHHGSKYSTTSSFLKKVNPQYAVISAGKNNTYDHPHQIILNRLKNNNINILRTDKQGTIIITTDGTNLKIDSKQTNTNGG